jgi:protein TonB
MAPTPIQPIAGQPTPGDSPQLASSPAPQVAAMAPAPSSASARTDYSWLSETILRRVEELKRYPAEARLDRAEGKVVLKAVIRGDGSVDDVEVYQSSGYGSLDHAAVELLQEAAPFQLPRPLGKSKMTVKIPMSYRLEQ